MFKSGEAEAWVKVPRRKEGLSFLESKGGFLWGERQKVRSLQATAAVAGNRRGFRGHWIGARLKKGPSVEEASC